MSAEFEKIVQAHQIQYPLMEPQDYGKLAYQNVFGPEHLIADESSMLRWIREEWDAVEAQTEPKKPEDIGGGLCRWHMNPDVEKKLAAEVLVKLFCFTANERTGSMEKLEKRLTILKQLPVSGMKEWLVEYRSRGYGAIGHSEIYRTAYKPHYRLVKTEYARLFSALLEAAKLAECGKPAVIAIDGRCGSGKTSLAALMARMFDCNVFHMDDFYLPKEKRAENWMDIPGGNMDLARFRKEVLEPVWAGEVVLYRRYHCGRGEFQTPERIGPKPLTIVEGSYSHHPELRANYDLKLFVTCEKEERLRRLREREGGYFPVFQQVWMPLEEQYIRLFGMENNGTMRVDTSVGFEK